MPRCLRLLTTCSASITGTLVSLAPCKTIVAAFYLIDFVNWQKLAQKISLRLGVAILDGRDRCHPRLRVGKEGLEVDNPKQIGGGLKKIGLLSYARHRHVATIGAAHDAEPRGIGDFGVD